MRESTPRESTPSFGDRLAAAVADHGQLCVGIDPHPYLLESWGLPDSAEGLRDFGLRVVDAARTRVGIVKPQVAFFERHGAAGYGALETVLAAARAAGLVVIADVKRGDVGSSVEAYAQAWLTPGSPLEADSMTIGAFQGVGSISAPIALARQHAKGLFVLAATSNPESFDIQTALVSGGEHDGQTVAAAIVNAVAELNRGEPAGAVSDHAVSNYAVGSFGVVLGATVDFDRYGISLPDLAARPATPILAPGFGQQGAQFGELLTRYRESAPHAIVSVSRSVLEVGPGGLAAAIARQASELAACRE